MRRYFLYITVALLAFAIGSFIAIKFYWSSSEQPLVSIPKDNQIEEVKEEVLQKDEIPTDEQFDEWKMNSFKPVIDKWLKNQKVEEYVELERSDEWASNSEHNARTALIDINGDGVKELAMQTGCATVGNCDFYLFKKTKSSYEIVLSTGMVQQYKLRKTKTNGYFDLETSAHGSATDGDLTRYKFNGNEYVADKCFYYEYKIIGKRKNQFITADKPTLTAKQCDEE